MKYFTVKQPLKAKEITNNYDRTMFALNRGQSTLMSLMANPRFWSFVEPPAQHIEVLDLSDTFNLGLEAEFNDGKLSDWKAVAVF